MKQGKNSFEHRPSPPVYINNFVPTPRTISRWAMFAVLISALTGTVLAQNPSARRAERVADATAFTLAPATLPASLVGRAFSFQFIAAGGRAPLRWRVLRGELPRGVQLNPAIGMLAGTPAQAGQFRFTVEVRDSSNNVAQREYVLIVHGLLEVRWQPPPRVNGNSITGSVVVTSYEDVPVDLTVVIVAVNEIGRATALGYQHFTLAPAARDVGSEKLIQFGADATPGSGSYIIHADAVAEIAARNVIHRARVQTAEPLRIAQP